MADIWNYKDAYNSYRVVQAGNSIRLYRNNVLHSQWNAKNPMSGKLWDLFLISSLGLKDNLSHVLVLGAGGGAVINLIHYYYPDAYIHAIDLDNIHLDIAKKYFNINKRKCKLVHDDAEAWLRNYNGSKFDLIIDDVFNEINKVPYRSIDSKSSWIRVLLKNLTKNGILVFNFADRKERKSNFKLWKPWLENKNIAAASHYKCDNEVVHISNNKISRKDVVSMLKENNYNDYMKYMSNGTISYKTLTNIIR